MAAINALGSAFDFGASATKKEDGRTQISRQQFLDLMVAELVNQDPMEPLDNNEFMNQLVQLQSMESTSSLTKGIGQLIRQTQIASAANLIGKAVRGVADDGGTVSGVVEGARVAGGEVRLLVAGRHLKLDSIQEILHRDVGDGDSGTGSAPQQG